MHEPHSLKKYCIFALIKAKRHLGDVGYLDVESLQAVLFHCSVEELRSIEDSTLAGSNRDLSWYTWHMWLDHFRHKFGQPRPDFEPPELLTDPPEDYVPTVTDPAPADWRAAYFVKREANEEKISKLGKEVKEMYQAAQQERESKQAQVCPKLPAKAAAPSKAPPLYAKPAAPSSATASQLPGKGSTYAPNSRPVAGASHHGQPTKVQGTSRLPGSSHGGPPQARPAPRPVKGLVRHTDAELEAELARRRGRGGGSGLQIADDEDDW